MNGLKSKIAGAFIVLAFAVLGLRISLGDPTARESMARLREIYPNFQMLKIVGQSFLLPDPIIDDRQMRLATLGRKLFFDPALSSSGKVACATCHQPQLSFTDGLPQAVGLARVERNTPTVINTFAQYWFFWDGRADSLAAQAVAPLEDALEHGITRVDVARRIHEAYRSEYEQLFGPLDSAWIAALPAAAKPGAASDKPSRKVLESALSSLGDSRLISQIATKAATGSDAPGEVFWNHLKSAERGTNNEELRQAYEKLMPNLRHELHQLMANVGIAIEAYEKGLVANQAPFDRFMASWHESSIEDPKPVFNDGFGPQQLLGFATFIGKGQCSLCHLGGAFTDNQFHNIGLPALDGKVSLGRSVGIQKLFSNEFNCDRLVSLDPSRSESESCKDLKFLDPDSPEALGSFKTPTLRNVAETAPYMHDGRMRHLRDVLQHYNRMDTVSAVGFKEETLKPLDLSELELQALESFLHSLTSPVRDLTIPATVH